tara:strand:- start:1804 stop:2046 length:243 start_codon:yes stop_codon:yes gene_type:complete
MLRRLFSHKCVGKKHLPERICLGWIKNVTSEKLRIVRKEWQDLKNMGWILMSKKRTGKSSSIHISINPRHLKDIARVIQE